MINFLKGIIVGIGGVAPGLSGSVLLVIFGLYQKTIEAIKNIFKKFKDNIKFLMPLGIGIVIGVLVFSKIISFLLTSFEMQTRFTFLGLVLGTIPLFYKEVKKEGFAKKYYIYILIAAVCGFVLFFFNGNMFPRITEPTLLQSFMLGIAYAASSVVPGVDSAVILSSLGLYELWITSLDTLNFSVLIPAAVGLGIGVLVISFIMSKLLGKYYTATFSIIFGLFLSIIPNVLNESCVLGMNLKSAVSILLVILGFVLSYYLGDIQGNNQKIKSVFSRKIKLQEKTK